MRKEKQSMGFNDSEHKPSKEGELMIFNLILLLSLLSLLIFSHSQLASLLTVAHYDVF